MNTESVPVSESKPRRRRRYGVIMKYVRRVHMYLGLLLFPWVLLYGASGMLYNHPEIGRDLERRALASDELAAASSFTPWQADEVAARVIETLNADAAAPYQLDSGSGAFTGYPLLAAPSRSGGRHVLIVNLEDGDALLTEHAAPAKADPAPFAGAAVELSDYSMAALEQHLQGSLSTLGVDAATELRAHPSIAPSLRFRMDDAEGQRWNVTYDLRSGEIDGRRADAPGQLAFVELLEKLHTTHHYPVHGGITWLWALLADITGITLVLWALTGLVMWWQMKPTRVLGTLAIAVAVLLAALIMGATAADIQFGNLLKGGP
ncbi:PepSY domain-containing protein [Haliangium ochraceum]|uniref:PepSY-associated TM helix domain protein n=1 Tax=Haliangium ochraceum (strain DSM 14365 / JCM 11303 / SMP-2) TaxID=502025 RepID=D0LFW9_HALO1|nr:PepSY domain-containing protein [Haliangium ochraceum]ACY14571.1 conserved hypothetical protein [Haliangium ochraceum DSM 14365]